MKKVSKILLHIISGVIVGLLLLIAGIRFAGHGYVFKAFRSTYMQGYTTAHIDDHPDFRNQTVKAGTPQPWPTHELYSRIQLTDTLRKELEDFRSTGFAVFKDGRILYEEYWNGYSERSLTNSFSMAKTVTTMLLGKAIEQGCIQSLDQPITDFLPEFLNDPFGSLCTVGHLSSMRSGFDWTEDYGRLSTRQPKRIMETISNGCC